MRSKILAACGVILVAGCAVTPHVEQSPEALRATHGYVRVSLPQDGSRGMLRLRPVKGGGDQIVMRQPGDQTVGAGVWTPAGEYQVTGLVRRDGGSYPPIRVEPGRITDLGAFVTLQLGGYEYVELSLSHPEADAQLLRATERLRPHLTQVDNLTWRTETVPKARQFEGQATGLGLIADLLMAYEREVNKPPLREQLKTAATPASLYGLAVSALPPITDEPGVGADGSLYYGAELGQVRVRRPDGQWRTLDTGTLASITAVEVTAEDLVVGTSSGAIRVSRDGGRTWNEAVMLAPSEAIVDIDRIGSRWLVISASLTPHPQAAKVFTMRGWRLHAAPSDDLRSLSVVRAATKTEESTMIWGMAVRGVVAGPDDYYVNGFHEVLKFDLKTMQAITLQPPQAAVTRLSVSQDGGLIAAMLARGAFSKLNVSTDGGITWRALDTPSYPVYDVHFDSLDQASASRMNVGAFSSTFEWVTYDPAQNRWIKSHEAPRGCARLLRDASGQQRFCLTSGGSILDRRDGKWVAEFAAD